VLIAGHLQDYSNSLSPQREIIKTNNMPPVKNNCFKGNDLAGLVIYMLKKAH
jgi:hypothetical protein